MAWPGWSVMVDTADAGTLAARFGAALHAALAIVQTPHRAYFVLRENGMQVGCEEEGVAEVWREALQCDERGVAR